MYSVLSGLLMLMMTCRENHDSRLPLLKHSSLSLKTVCLPKALTYLPFCTIQNEMYQKDVALRIGAISHTT